MTVAGLAGTGAAVKDGSGRDPARVRDAAQQFESLLIGQMLRSVRESGSGWLGSGEDAAGDCATDFAEQQFAGVLAKSGGLGIADLIARGLESR
jgi:Rod binding domain-containing protein